MIFLSLELLACYLVDWPVSFSPVFNLVDWQVSFDPVLSTVVDDLFPLRLWLMGWL